MNKKLKKVKQVNRKAKAVVVQQKKANLILQSIKCTVLGFLTLALLLVGFGNIPTLAVPVDDFTFSSLSLKCEGVSFQNTTFSCSTSNLNYELPIGFQIGTGSTFGGSLTQTATSYVVSGIPTPSTIGDYTITYQGSGLTGGNLSILRVVDAYLTPAQDLTIPKICSDYQANEIIDGFENCSFVVPDNVTIPIGYKLGVLGSSSGAEDYCYIQNNSIVSCVGFNTGILTGTQTIFSSLNPAGANDSINIFPYMTPAQDASIPYTCLAVPAGTPTTCTGLLPRMYHFHSIISLE